MSTSPTSESRFEPGATSRGSRSTGDGPVRGAFVDANARLPLATGRALTAEDGPEAWIEALFDARPESWLRRIQGRETFAWPLPAGSSEKGETGLVVKRYRGDEARDRWYERLRGRRPRSPGRREGENLAALESLGLRVPPALAWFEDGRGKRSAVVMKRLPASRHLRNVLQTPASRASTEPDDPELKRWARELVELTARFHEAGWYHRDLYLVHLLPAPELYLLDVGRARREPRPRRRWFVKDLAALLVSAPPEVPRSVRLRFLREYLRLRGLTGRGEFRAWSRAIRAKARRLAAHAPRRVDPTDGARRY